MTSPDTPTLTTDQAVSSQIPPHLTVQNIPILSDRPGLPSAIPPSSARTIPTSRIASHPRLSDGPSLSASSEPIRCPDYPCPSVTRQTIPADNSFPAFPAPTDYLTPALLQLDSLTNRVALHPAIPDVSALYPPSPTYRPSPASTRLRPTFPGRVSSIRASRLPLTPLLCPDMSHLPSPPLPTDLICPSPALSPTTYAFPSLLE
jgi:hypothetical protein